MSTIHSPSNRPRVFLSHSSKDKAFIEQLHNDLRRCQIDPWLDSEKIRHGEPWLDAIFGGGISTCDAVLVYLTPDSVESPMVKKEIDAGIIKKLRDERIAFLPYVSSARLRDDLRPDIQALQTPEWSEANYAELLPRVVAEIWHSFTDRQVVSALNAEKVKRLEMELELEKLKNSGQQGIFSGQETSDFEFIWQQLDRFEPIEFQLVRHHPAPPERPRSAHGEVLNTHRFRVHLQNIVANLDTIVGTEYNANYLQRFLVTSLATELPRATDKPNNDKVRQSRQLDLRHELRMYGFLQASQKTVAPSSFSAAQASHSEFCDVFTDRMYRFKYWLAHQRKLSSDLRWENDPPVNPS